MLVCHPTKFGCYWGYKSGDKIISFTLPSDVEHIAIGWLTSVQFSVWGAFGIEDKAMNARLML